ncbi:hypothetical protein [Thauera chlorobenzoica]|uniref:hypothetical protein n=1 Tax=Thauera chlorobenzoica TaxID=96773 RepID=UPI00089F8ABF|nr:hypothetical protein [Thauera chlorobenzoica]SEF84618.1 hypothetical protein SAMN05216242_107102 [Thauera chlorobenzoica]
MADTNMLTDALRTADACIAGALALAQFKPTERGQIRALLESVMLESATALSALEADTEGGEA